MVYELIGEISSGSEGDSDELEAYLLTNPEILDCQVMARTKQTERKEQNDRQQQSTSAVDINWPLKI